MAEDHDTRIRTLEVDMALVKKSQEDMADSVNKFVTKLDGAIDIIAGIDRDRQANKRVLDWFVDHPQLTIAAIFAIMYFLAMADPSDLIIWK